MNNIQLLTMIAKIKETVLRYIAEGWIVEKVLLHSDLIYEMYAFEDIKNITFDFINIIPEDSFVIYYNEAK